MKKSTHVAALVGVAALTLAGCGERPGDDEDSTANEGSTTTAQPSDTHTPEGQYPDFKACMVSDSGGFDDKSFNQTSHDGMVSAKKQYGIQTAEVQSNSDAEYENNIRALVRQQCDVITTVGFKLGPATDKLARANPEVDFAIVDYAYFNDGGENVAQPNVKGLTFNTDEPAFMAGHLAAAQSESGIVGTLGGAKIPTVTIFMDGFAKGVEHYNEQRDADVQVTGYDPETQDGSFTNDFENKSKGESLARTLIQQGADVIMPVPPGWAAWPQSRRPVTASWASGSTPTAVCPPASTATWTRWARPGSVTENVMLGREPRRLGLLGLRRRRKRVRELSERCRLRVDPDATARAGRRPRRRR